MKRLLLLAIFIFLASSILGRPVAYRDPPLPMITFGGGHVSAGSHHSGGVAQVEWRPGIYYFHCIRPQVTLLSPELKALFLGVGFGIECFMGKHFIIIPSFEPGLYYKGKSRNLGYPLEFRSCIDVAYEHRFGWRIGAQFFHISNASLGRHNPGANTALLYLGIPL